MSGDGRSDESRPTEALSTPGAGHPSTTLASGQYSLDQSVNKSPSHLRERQKNEKERGVDRNEEKKNTGDSSQSL